MLSYQHEYHAGNHADIIKHICLVRILQSLRKKNKPFTIIDSHAGAGRFSLEDERILKTGEAEEGIKKLMESTSNQKSIPDAVLSYITAERPYFNKSMYAGSVELERLFLRKGDRHFVIEKHPQAVHSLQLLLKMPVFTNENEQDAAVRTVLINKDSYEQLNALTPPEIKRGLVLCDPSYEEDSDYTNITNALKIVRKKWNTAIIVLWYPLLTRKKNKTAQMLSELEDFSKLGTMPCESFRCELIIKNQDEIPEESKAHMYGSGMLVINPPWHLKEDMAESIDFLKTKCGFLPQ
ncbi:MAG: 23S rRNA (adenine(2030)-N(6))-methyltransferase RlmJ [Treponema sp.]|nr:23S rRNA (adenine(2030)-N(6))-methyltransferase RlmJ [Treponema sp.]